MPHVCTHDHLHTTYVHMTTYAPHMYTWPPMHHVCTHDHLCITYVHTAASGLQRVKTL